jgi:hypothetical protein
VVTREVEHLIDKDTFMHFCGGSSHRGPRQRAQVYYDRVVATIIKWKSRRRWLPFSNRGFEAVSILAYVISPAAGKRSCAYRLTLFLERPNERGGEIIGILAMAFVIAFPIRDKFIGFQLFEVVVRTRSLYDDCPVSHYWLPY